MRILFLCLLIAILACSTEKQQETQLTIDPLANGKYLVQMLDTIWIAEQVPITKRDSLMNIYGVDSKEADVYREIYRQNHAINIIKIRTLLDNHGWPKPTDIGAQGNRTICNVLQHDDQETREQYLPMMRQAVLDNILEPAYLVRAEDRLATDRGELQIYGGQMKYYPETQTFNVWPVHDPVNIDKRRAEIGLGSIAEHLKNRFDFEWDLEEQLQRTAAFEEEKAGLTE